MRNLVMVLEYDGSEYFGWQSQPHRKTLQDTFEHALSAILHEPIRSIASGRTDRGVHALGQVVTVNMNSRMPAELLIRALNGTLPTTLRVLTVRECPGNFHARKSVVGKEYRYLWYSGSNIPVFLYQRAFWSGPRPPDVELLRAMAEWFVGTHDFTSFSATGSDVAHPVRTIRTFEITPVDTRLIVFRVVGDGFLYRMVRMILGELWMVVRGKRMPEEILDGIANPGRSVPRMCLPPQGLYLVQVEYEWVNPYDGLVLNGVYPPWLRWEASE